MEEDPSSENVDVMSDKEFQYEYSEEYEKALGYIYNPENRDIEKAIAMLEKEAASNNVLACMELGKIYERGLQENEEVYACMQALAFSEASLSTCGFITSRSCSRMICTISSELSAVILPFIPCLQ